MGKQILQSQALSVKCYHYPRDELIARVQKALGREAYGIAPEDALLRDVKWLKQLESVAEFAVGRVVERMLVSMPPGVAGDVAVLEP